MNNNIFSYAFRALTALGRKQSANVTIAELAERQEEESPEASVEGEYAEMADIDEILGF